MLWLFTTTLSWVRSRRSRKTHPVVSLMDHVRPYLSSFVLEEKSRREKWRQSKCRRELPICASGKTSLSPGGRTGPLGIFTDPAHPAESPLRTGFLSTVDSGKRGGETRSPCTSGLRLTMGQRSNPLAWEWFRRVQVCTQARMVSRA